MHSEEARIQGKERGGLLSYGERCPSIERKKLPSNQISPLELDEAADQIIVGFSFHQITTS